MHLLMLSDLLEATANPRLVACVSKGFLIKHLEGLVVVMSPSVFQYESELEHPSVRV